MSTTTEYLQCTPNMKNDKYRPCSCFILDKKGKYIRVHISKYMQNETEYCKLYFISFYLGPYFEPSLNNNSCVQKSGILRFPLLVLLNHFWYLNH